MSELTERDYPPDATPETKFAMNVLDMLGQAASEYHTWVRSRADVDGGAPFTLAEWADRVIALVRADERRRIREAIESEELVDRAIAAFNEAGEGNMHATSLFADHSDSPDAIADRRQIHAALTAAATAPPSDDLDALLDSVHAKDVVVGLVRPQLGDIDSEDFTPYFACDIWTDESIARRIPDPASSGTGPTRMAAIRDAVARAKGGGK